MKRSHLKQQPNDIGLGHIKFQGIFLMKLGIASVPCLDMQECLSRKLWISIGSMRTPVKESGTIIPRGPFGYEVALGWPYSSQAESTEA